MKPENITSDNLVSLVKDHLKFKEIIADPTVLEAAIKIITTDGWDLFMLAALYQTSGRYTDLINSVSEDKLSEAMSHISVQNDHILLLTLYFQGLEKFNLLKNKIEPLALGKALLFLAQKIMVDDFNLLTDAIGTESSNMLMLNALKEFNPLVPSRSSSLQLLSSNIPSDIFEKNIENKDNAHLYELICNLSPIKLNHLLILASEKSVDSLINMLNGLNTHSVAKAVLINEKDSNLLMQMMESKIKTAVIVVWIDFLHNIGVLNRVAVKFNQRKENLLIIALHSQEEPIVKKLIVLLHQTVLQKTLLFLLANKKESAFDKLWSLLDEKLRGQVLVDAANYASATELKSFVCKVKDFAIKILLSVLDVEFTLLVNKIAPKQLADFLLIENDSRGKLINRWIQLNKETLSNVLNLKNDIKSSVFVRLGKSLDSDAFSLLVNHLSETRQLVTLATETNDYGQDVLMFSSYFQEENAFLLLAKKIHKENKLNELTTRKDGGNNTVVTFLSQRKPLEPFAMFLCMLDINALSYNLPILFENIKKSSVENKDEKIAISHIFRIHHLILSQSQKEDGKLEDILDINHSRKVLKDLNFSSMSKLLMIYEECFMGIQEEMKQHSNTIIKVKQILSTPYEADDSETESTFSTFVSWLTATTGNNKKYTTGKVMEHLNQMTHQ